MCVCVGGQVTAPVLRSEGCVLLLPNRSLEQPILTAEAAPVPPTVGGCCNEQLCRDGDLVGLAEFLLARDHRQWRASAGVHGPRLVTSETIKDTGQLAIECLIRAWCQMSAHYVPPPHSPSGQA